MANTVYTPDGKTHCLLSDTTLWELLETYAGADVARFIREEYAALEEDYTNDTIDEMQGELDDVNADLRNLQDLLRGARNLVQRVMLVFNSMKEHPPELTNALDGGLRHDLSMLVTEIDREV